MQAVLTEHVLTDEEKIKAGESLKQAINGAALAQPAEGDNATEVWQKRLQDLAERVEAVNSRYAKLSGRHTRHKVAAEFAALGTHITTNMDAYKDANEGVEKFKTLYEDSVAKAKSLIAESQKRPGLFGRKRGMLARLAEYEVGTHLLGTQKMDIHLKAESSTVRDKVQTMRVKYEIHSGESLSAEHKISELDRSVQLQLEYIAKLLSSDDAFDKSKLVKQVDSLPNDIASNLDSYLPEEAGTALKQLLTKTDKNSAEIKTILDNAQVNVTYRHRPAAAG